MLNSAPIASTSLRDLPQYKKVQLAFTVTASCITFVLSAFGALSFAPFILTYTTLVAAGYSLGVYYPTWTNLANTEENVAPHNPDLPTKFGIAIAATLGGVILFL